MGQTVRLATPARDRLRHSAGGPSRPARCRPVPHSPRLPNPDVGEPSQPVGPSCHDAGMPTDDLPTSPPATPDPGGPGGSAQPAWVRRFTAARVSVPAWARDTPDRCVLTSNASGTWEVHAWDRSRSPAGGTAEGPGFRQVTDRPNGTLDAAIPPDGEQVWWFADTDGDEYGTWRCQPFVGGPEQAALPGLPAAYSVGLEFGADGTGRTVVSGSADDAYGTRVHLSRPGTAPVLVYEHESSAEVSALSRDGMLLAIDHSEHGDARHPAVRVLDPGPGAARGRAARGRRGAVGRAGALDRGAWRSRRCRGTPGCSSSTSGRAGRRCSSGTPRRDARPSSTSTCRASSPVTGCPTAAAWCCGTPRPRRSSLYRWDLDRPGPRTTAGRFRWRCRRARCRSPPCDPTERPGSAGPARRSHRSCWASRPPLDPAPVAAGRKPGWCSARPAPRRRTPWRSRTCGSMAREDRCTRGCTARSARTVAGPAGAAAGVRGRARRSDQPGRPTRSAPGPAAWVDAGFAVLRVNYRGSLGYGAAWRDALEADVGFTELADIAAVRDALRRRRRPGREPVRARRRFLGRSSSPCWAWAPSRTGGRSGGAAVPVADYVAAYEDEMEPLKAFGRLAVRRHSRAGARALPGRASAAGPGCRTSARRCSSWPVRTTRAARSARSRTTCGRSPTAVIRTRSTGSTPDTGHSWSPSGSARVQARAGLRRPPPAGPDLRRPIGNSARGRPRWRAHDARTDRRGEHRQHAGEAGHRPRARRGDRELPGPGDACPNWSRDLGPRARAATAAEAAAAGEVVVVSVPLFRYRRGAGRAAGRQGRHRHRQLLPGPGRHHRGAG